MADELEISEYNRKKMPQVATNEVYEKLAKRMSDITLKEKEQETKAQAAILGYPYIELKGFPISPETLSLVSEETSAKLKAISFYFVENRDLRVAAVNPENPELEQLIKSLAEEHGLEPRIYMISRSSFDYTFRLYSVLPRIRAAIGGVEIKEEDFKKFEQEIKTFRDLDQKIKKVSMTDMVTLVIAAAIKSRSSDIHIECEEDEIKVRYRIDGILQDVAAVPKKVWPQIIARIKLLSKLKINIKDKPQDGRFTIFLSKEKIDVRVSCLPTTYGESVVMRLLMSSAVGLNLDNLGLRGKAYDDLMREIAKPNGMIITTGPTGSGKTTTLYAVLNKLNNPETKIITIEDPVEYRLSGITQSQVERGSGYTFASGLRSILRQDPDIVMVGEIRDLETADIAINAALTGHLVLSTLHTNDASGTVPRFLAMNVKPFLLAPALNAMIGQRLVRRICEHCKEEMVLESKVAQKVREILSAIPASSGFQVDVKKAKFYRGKGCDACQGLGFKGRIGIYEIMAMNKEVEELIMSGHVSEYDMLKIGVKYGMITMTQDGLLKAIEGLTTVEEVFRVAKDTSQVYTG